MGFIIRSVFWLSLVLLLIPFGGTGEGGETVNPLQAMFAAKGAIEDMAGMCERRPDVCAVGRAAVQTIGVRAREGAKLAYQALGEGADAEEPRDEVADVIAQAADQKAVTGSVTASP